MRSELRRALWEAVLSVRDGKGWPLSDRVPAKPTNDGRGSDITTTLEVKARAGKVAEQIARLKTYAAQNPHIDIEAVIRQLERQQR